MYQNKISRYLCSDLLRVLQSKRIFWAISCTIAVIFFALEGSMDFTASVLYAFTSATYKAEFYAVFIFCAFPAAGCFSEDLEGNCLRYSVIRGDLKRYVVSKIIIIFFTGVFVMAVSCFLFGFLCRIWLPWQDSDTKEVLMTSGGLRCFLKGNTEYLWLLFYGVQQGMLAGVLALLSSLLSLFVTNKMLVFASPVFFYQMIDELGYGFFGDLGKLRMSSIFDASYSLFDSDLISFLWAALYSLTLAVLLSFIIYKKVRKRL